MRLVDVTADGLKEFCTGLGVSAHMHPCMGALIVDDAPGVLYKLILDSCDYWKQGDLCVCAHFKGWMCVMPRKEQK